MKRARFARSSIRGSRPPAGDELRTANLNVRATPEQYRCWQVAADAAEVSLSSWVARWLDEAAGVPGRLLLLLEKLGPRHQGRVPVRDLTWELYRRWGWTESETRRALRRLEELDLVHFVVAPSATLLERIAGPDPLRAADGGLVTHVTLPPGLKPRPTRRLW